ncbi:jun-like transcription factor [Coemansia biformis]|uniref:Jun-like transcription factor n=1 Tax=Coemansia biformis TaxID=1286918 RepID=A0A9W7YFX6_9FUNG|nr:jun-like transcription factor [Coemansia biformis]
MVASKAERLLRLQALLADCGMEKTVTTLVAEAAQVGKSNKAVQAFLELAVVPQTAETGAKRDLPPSSKNGASPASSGSSSESSASYKSATGEQLASSHGTASAPGSDAPAAGKRKRAGGPGAETAPRAVGQQGRHPKRGEVANAPNTPFCRIRPEEVVYADARLKDNRYTSKGGVESDFGYKAHQDLIVTRGKAFTKEKNKKKRGSYSGGRISMASCSIKFT